jgi:arylsulfatase A-like enzyme
MRASLGALWLVLAAAACSNGGNQGSKPDPGERPNIVWIVADDMSFEIRAFGDPLARTPNLDRLAAEGVTFTNAFATSGVCAPSRAALITGHYATTIGAHHMRSIDRGYQPVPPPEVKTFTEHLRAAGYYTSSQTKLDYQFSGVLTDAPITNWDDPSGLWHGRDSDQPFFASITIFETHESRLLGDNSTTVTDPAAVTVPPYYPDTPLVRADFARHYDNVEAMDANVGMILEMLEEEGLLEETVVMFFADTPYGQSIAFRDQLATMQEIYRLESEGALDPPADWYFRQTKPLEELYDTQNDPFELTNLADEPKLQGVLERMRGAHEAWVARTGDLGSVPESDR